MALGDLRPAHLHDFQQRGIVKGWARRTINDHCERIRRLVRWAIERELCEPGVLYRLQSVRALQKGRTKAREGEPVQLIPFADMELILQHLKPRYRILCRLHYLLGCRAEEVVELKAEEVDRTVTPWRIDPQSHKTQHMGQRRVIFVGKQAQAILETLLATTPRGYLFPGKPMGRHCKMRYRGPVTVSGYRQAMKGASRRAGVDEATPIQVRHTSLTRIREQYGESAAQAVAGHASVNTTQIYTARMDALATRVAQEWG